MNEEKNNIVKGEEKDKTEEGTKEEKDKKEENEKEKPAHRKEKRLAKPEARGSYDFGRLLIGLLVVFVGSLLLAKSAGILPNAFSVEIFHFWPLLIVAFGLSLLDARSRLGSAVGFVTLLLVVLILAVFLRDSARKADTNIRVRNIPQGITQDSGSPQYHIYSDWGEAR